LDGSLGRGILNDVMHFLDAVGRLQGSEHVVDSQVKQEYNRRYVTEGGDCMT
jgi:hypothetical protein